MEYIARLTYFDRGLVSPPQLAFFREKMYISTFRQLIQHHLLLKNQTFESACRLSICTIKAH